MVSTALSEGLPPAYLHPEPDWGPLPSGWDLISSSLNILPSPLPSHHYFEFVFINSPVFHDSFATYIYIPDIYMYMCI